MIKELKTPHQKRVKWKWCNEEDKKEYFLEEHKRMFSIVLETYEILQKHGTIKYPIIRWDESKSFYERTRNYLRVRCYPLRRLKRYIKKVMQGRRA